MLSTKMTADEFQVLLDAGRIAYSDNGTFGQTGAGFHASSSAEKVATASDVLWPWDGVFCYEPASGRLWTGSTRTYRVMPADGAALEPASTTMDPVNLAYQRSRMA